VSVCDPTVYGPCDDYATIDDVRALCDTGTLDLVAADPDADPPVEEGADVALVTEMLRYASRRTFLATGQRFWGCCEATIRPAALCHVCGATDWSCGCNRWPMLSLPFLPARSVDDVTIDGTTLDPSAYALVDHASLARIDGEPWPTCNDLTLADTEEGTWTVTFHHGLDLPPEAVPLVAQFAVELAKACRGVECGLGPGIRVVHRDGVDFEIVDAPLGEHSTGYGPLDQWIGLLHGGHVAEPPRLYNPMRRQRRNILEPSVSAS
jgi:hypothetical protein